MPIVGAVCSFLSFLIVGVFGGAAGVLAAMQLTVVGDESARLTVPDAGITSIEPVSRRWHTFEEAGVRLCVAKHHVERICAFSRRTVGRQISITIGCETVARPFMREPLCGGCLEITATDRTEAEALAARLRAASQVSCAPES
jgi:preprotein translocase subunit SecD